MTKEKEIMAEGIKKKDTLTDSQIDQTIKATGNMLKKYPKVKIRVPKDNLNPGDSFVVAAINGYIFQIKRSETVEVPEPVAKLLEQGGYI